MIDSDRAVKEVLLTSLQERTAFAESHTGSLVGSGRIQFKGNECHSVVTKRRKSTRVAVRNRAEFLTAYATAARLRTRATS